MANNELVMTYLKRLEKHLNGRKVEELPFNDVNLLKCLISKIISDNNDYLLTDNYLYDLVCHFEDNDNFKRSLCERLAKLASNNHYDLVYEVKSGFNRIICDNVRGKLMDNFYKVSDEYIELLNTFYASLNRIWFGSPINVKTEEKRLFREIFVIIMAACVVDRETDKYSTYCAHILDHRDEFMEILRINGVRDGMDASKFFEVYPFHDLYKNMVGDHCEIH